MNIWENAVVTAKGISLLTKLVEGNTLDITRAETGEGYVTPGLLNQLTEVSIPKQALSFRAVSYPEEGKCQVPCYLTNDGLETGYTATQVGIYATDPDEGEILFLVLQAPSGQGTIIPSESEMPGYSAEWALYMQYGQADGVHVEVDPTNAVSVEEFEKYKVEVKAKFDEIQSAYIVTLSSTDGVNYTGTIDGLKSLYNGLEIVAIPSRTSTSRNINITINELKTGTVYSHSYISDAEKCAPSISVNWFRTNTPYKLLCNNQGDWYYEGRAAITPGYIGAISADNMERKLRRSNSVSPLVNGGAYPASRVFYSYGAFYMYIPLSGARDAVLVSYDNGKTWEHSKYIYEDYTDGVGWEFSAFEDRIDIFRRDNFYHYYYDRTQNGIIDRVGDDVYDGMLRVATGKDWTLKTVNSEFWFYNHAGGYWCTSSTFSDDFISNYVGYDCVNNLFWALDSTDFRMVIIEPPTTTEGGTATRFYHSLTQPEGLLTINKIINPYNHSANPGETYCEANHKYVMLCGKEDGVAVWTLDDVENPDWTMHTLPDGDWTDFAYGNGIYVLTDATNNQIAYSSDLDNWTTEPTGFFEGGAIEYGNNTFVVCSKTMNTVYMYQMKDEYGTLRFDDFTRHLDENIMMHVAHYMVNNPKTCLSDIGGAPAYTYGTEDLTAGESKLEPGKLYFVYE